jgi:hypothetical protein
MYVRACVDADEATKEPLKTLRREWTVLRGGH